MKNKNFTEQKPVLDKNANNKICHYCGEVIHNVMSDSSESYVDENGNWYCSQEEYSEYHSVNSIF